MNLLGRSSSGNSDNGILSASENSSYAVGGSGDIPSASSALDLDFLLRDHSVPTNSDGPKDKKSSPPTADDLLNGDDAMVDLSDDSIIVAASAPTPQVKPPQEMPEPMVVNDNIPIANANCAHKVNIAPEAVQRTNSNNDFITNAKPADSSKVVEVKSLNDISVSLDSIKPG